MIDGGCRLDIERIRSAKNEKSRNWKNENRRIEGILIRRKNEPITTGRKMTDDSLRRNPVHLALRGVDSRWKKAED